MATKNLITIPIKSKEEFDRVCDALKEFGNWHTLSVVVRNKNYSHRDGPRQIRVRFDFHGTNEHGVYVGYQKPKDLNQSVFPIDKALQLIRERLGLTPPTPELSHNFKFFL